MKKKDIKYNMKKNNRNLMLKYLISEILAY